MPSRDDELTITLSRREWVKICAALVMRTGVDPKAQPILEKLHPIVIEPLTENGGGVDCPCATGYGSACVGCPVVTDREVGGSS